jgi:hypothetical protein
MANQSFWDHPIEKLEEALNLKKQIHALESKLSNLFGMEEESRPTSTPQVATRGGQRGKRSAAVRAKMAAAQQARWARLRGGKKTPVGTVKPAKGGPKKRILSPEGRARIVAALKARHAANRRARNR